MPRERKHSHKRLAENAERARSRQREAAARTREMEERRRGISAALRPIAALTKERIATFVSDHGGPRELSRTTGIPHNTILGWTKGGSLPSFDAVQRLSHVIGVSADWVMGFDAPAARRLGRDGRFDEPIRSTLVHDLAVERGLGEGFVAAALPVTEQELRSCLIDRYSSVVGELALRKLQAELTERMDALPPEARAWPGQPSIASELAPIVRDLQQQQSKAERAALAHLPGVYD